MGSNGAENAAILGNDKAKCSETTVEIKIKTLDSQTYTLRVDKCVSVPALKEQIATVTGVLSEQQRLICRGKVLKDDQLLSAYHVEDGHTLHLVVRQPAVPSAENASDHPEGDPASSSGHSPGSRVGASVLVGSFNISEQGDGIPDLGRIVSSVLNSFGITGGGSSSEDTNLNEPVRERATIFALSGQRISSRQQPDQVGIRNQSIPNISTSSHPAVDPSESLQPPVIPDSLTTLLQYLTHLRQEFDINVGGLNNISQAAEPRGVDGQDIDATSHSSGPAGLPTPASLAEVVMSTRQLLNEQTAECLLQLASQMEYQANVTDPSERTRIQTYALRSGALLQNLGASLLELGRTMMTLRMGQTSGDAIVNAGPAIFISTTGPNPIMVQPLPLQPGSSLGAIPVGTVQNSTGSAGVSVRSGFAPRNIDIRIRTARDRRDQTSSRHQVQTVPPTSDNSTSAQQATVEGTGPSSGREPEVRVLPLRSLLSAAPAPIVHSTSDSSGRSLGVFFPVLARVQHVTSGNSNNTRASQASDQNHARSVDTGRSPMPNSAAHQEHNGVPNLDVGGTSNGQGFSAQIHDGLNQLLRTIISGEHLHGDNVESHNVGTDPVEVHTVVGQDANGSQEATPPVSEEGLLLSNILRQVMPIISESMGTTSNSSSGDGGNVVQNRTTQASTQALTNPDQGRPFRRRSSRQRREPPSQPSPPKRQRRE